MRRFWRKRRILLQLDSVKKSSVITPFGGVVIFAAFFILIRSLVTRNSYEIVLVSAVLLLMLVLCVIGVWKSRKLKTIEAGWKTPSPITAGFNNAESKDDAKNPRAALTSRVNVSQVTGLDGNIPLFYRLHFLVEGRFFPCGDHADTSNDCVTVDDSAAVGDRAAIDGGCPVLVETSVPRKETSAQFLFDFPMSGIFHGEGNCKLCDIFGFFSFSCGQPQPKTINIRSAPCFGKKVHISAQSGAEDKRSKPSVDEERYYMREYTPGDRLRDINWKSSDRIDTLITRISTDTQERISRIEVHFRNYCQNAAKKEHCSLEALWLLDRAKARLTYFLRSIKEQNSSFIFDVRAAQGSWEIEDDEDLDTFLEELAGLSFMPPKIETAAAPNTGDLYVFSTACDTGLQSFLLVCNPRPVTLFLSQKPELSAANTRTEENEILRFNDFISKGCTPPLSWFKKSIQPLGVNIGKMETNYAEIKL